MEQIIYADVLFLIDVSMDFFSLYITAFILKLKLKSANALFAAIIGAVYSVISVIARAESLFLTFVISAIMCFVAFFGNGFFVLVKSLICFYLVSVILGGAMTLIFNLFNSITGLSKDVLIYGELNTVNESLPLPIFIIGFFIIVILSKVFFKIFSKAPSKVPVFCSITLFGKTCDMFLAEDSGNTLVEPISGEPVIFLSESALRRIADDECISAMKMGKSFYEGKYQSKFRILVYKTVSGSDICACVKAENIIIDKKRCRAWLAIGKNMNLNNIDGIIPSSLLV